MIHALTILLAVTACIPSSPVGEEIPRPEVASQDRLELFKALARALKVEGRGEDLRVDPRPLRADPTLVTVQPFRGAPDKLRIDSWDNPYAEIGPLALEERRIALQRLDITDVMGFPFADCPWLLTPLTPEVEERKRVGCPMEKVQVALVALPRAGGAYWPSNRDDRAKYGARSVFSLRTIVREYSRYGKLERATDYVFERQGTEWVLLEKRVLLIVE